MLRSREYPAGARPSHTARALGGWDGFASVLSCRAWRVGPIQRADLAHAGTPRVLLGFGPPHYRSLSALGETSRCSSARSARTAGSSSTTCRRRSSPRVRLPARPPAHGPHCAQRAADRCCRSTVGSSSSSCVPKRCRPGPRATAALRGTRTALRTLVALPYGIQPSAARAPSPYPPGEVSVGMCRHARTADCICICARGGGMPVCACRIYGAMAARVSGIVTKFHAMVDHVSYPTACCLVPPLAPEMQVPRAA